MRVERDRHHIFNTKLEWEARREAAAIRQSAPLIPTIDRDLHNEIHRLTPPVPLLGYHALKQVLGRYQPQRTTLASIDNVVSAIEYAARHPKAHDIERAQAHLAIEAIILQRDILRGNVA